MPCSPAPSILTAPDLGFLKTDVRAWDGIRDIYRLQRMELPALPGLCLPQPTRSPMLWLAIPAGEPPQEGFPCLYMLDGNAAISNVPAQELRTLYIHGRAPVVAAIGHDSPYQFDVQARNYHYTPVVPDPHACEEARRYRVTGGADSFRDWLAQQVMPQLFQHVRVHPLRQTLWGHSLGGLFAIYVLLTRPALFQNYAAADPALWWHRHYIHHFAACASTAMDRSPGTSSPLRLLNMLAAPRTDRPPRGSTPQEVHDFMQGLQARLHPRLRIETWYFPHLTHGPLLNASIAPALQLASWPVTKKPEAGTLFPARPPQRRIAPPKGSP